MKKIKYIVLGCIIIFGSASCKKWLDVNKDPDNPSNTSTLIQNRISFIQNEWKEPAGVTNFRASCIAGVYYSLAATQNTLSTTWQASNGNSTTPYQAFFVGVSSNITDLYNLAQKQGAYHYMAAADVFHALGYMEMLDVYGEMPYTQAGTGIPSPAPDDGKTIYNGCMAHLNEAIALFSKAQESGAPALSAGDIWNNGSVDKWLKLCWGLKARYMLKLSKKADFNADSILYCLSQGPQSNADNIVEQNFNNTTTTDFLEGDPVSANGNYDWVAYGSNNRIAEYYYNLLTNLRGAGVVDPRMPKIVPATMDSIKFDASNGKVSSYKWLRSIGVNSYNTKDKNPAPLGFPNRLVKLSATSIVTPTYASTNTTITYTITDATDLANFIAAQAAVGRTYTVTGNKVAVTYKPGAMYVNSTNYIQAGDTVYVNLRSNSLATTTVGQDQKDVTWYPNAAAYNAGVVASTGSFQIRPVSDMEILMYHEMCFIKAEVYMRKGDVANAYAAYRAGIQAHLDYMQSKLNSWKNNFDKITSTSSTNPDMDPMDQTAINTYLASNAVAQGPATLTMSDIMLQKYIAMGCSIENWNDMRRFNFSAGNVGSFGVVYPGYPGFPRGTNGFLPLFTGQAQITGSTLTDPRSWIRRFALPPTYEIQYNFINTTALNPHATDLNIWSMPVWWDCATDAEYYNYLK